MIENCWQHKDCGMQPGAPGALERGEPCPATRATELHGANRGRNAGRACWIIEGTFCDGVEQGNFVQKLNVCRGCDFHALVRREEGDDYIATSELLTWIRD
jgi:hypothetical protein